MDLTPPEESYYSETSSDIFNSLSKETSEFTIISDKEILTLKKSENEIVNTNLLNPKLTQENISLIDQGNRTKIRISRQSETEKLAEIREMAETEQKVLKNIENLQMKIKEKENELEQCVQEAKRLCKEHKSAEALIHKIKYHYEQNFGIKLDSEETDGGFIVRVYFSDEQNVKPVELLFDENNQNISLLPSDYLTENQRQILQESLEDEKQITPVFCILREIVLNEY